MTKLIVLIVLAFLSYVVLFGVFYICGNLPAKTKVAEFWHFYAMIFWFAGVVLSWLDWINKKGY